MTMILEPEAERLAADIAKKTGQAIAVVLKTALTAHAQAVGVLPTAPRSSEDRFDAMLAIARRAALRPVLDSRSPDEIIGYNDLGLPG